MLLAGKGKENGERRGGCLCRGDAGEPKWQGSLAPFCKQTKDPGDGGFFSVGEGGGWFVLVEISLGLGFFIFFLIT